MKPPVALRPAARAESTGPIFAAIDFETANRYKDSACAIGVAIVQGGRIVHSVHRLIRPPSRWFIFTWVHGIVWKQVEEAPPFGTVWQEIAPLLEGVDFLAAHNAPFDRGVLEACLKRYRLPVPKQPFVCSVQVARKVWNLRPTSLSDVCAHLDIPLNHHHALSDAEGCARVLLAAIAEGWHPPDREPQTPQGPDPAPSGTAAEHGEDA